MVNFWPIILPMWLGTLFAAANIRCSLWHLFNLSSVYHECLLKPILALSMNQKLFWNVDMRKWYNSTILDLGTRWRHVVAFRLLQIFTWTNGLLYILVGVNASRFYHHHYFILVSHLAYLSILKKYTRLHDDMLQNTELSEILKDETDYCNPSEIRLLLKYYKFQ